MNKTSIEWTDLTWNPVEGCNKVSAGCRNCYAERITNRFQRRQFTHVEMRPEKLTEPMKVRKPSRIFPCDMSDLFHDAVSDQFIKQVFSVMASCPQHTFQVLTKRIDRASQLIRSFQWTHGTYELQGQVLANNLMGIGVTANRNWRPPNIWIGTSVENQALADERIPILMHVPAKIFLSCEPLLGPIDFDLIPLPDYRRWPIVDWVICGGESGPDARPMHPDWARSLRDQCRAIGVPFFFKQWGEWLPVAFKHVKMPKHKQGDDGHLLEGVLHQNFPL